MSTLSHYHKCIRKITTSFASLFNNIVLIKDDGQRLIVPLEYANKEKFYKRLQGDPDLDKKIQITLPRISYEMTGFGYDRERKLNTNNKNFAINPSNPDNAFMQYNPVPYDFEFGVTIYTRNVEDGNQIIEQILPYFTIDYSMKVNLIPEMGISRVLPVVLNGAKQIIDADGLFNTEVRTVMWTLSFTVKGYVFGAVKDVPIIKEVNEEYIASIGGAFGNKLGCGTSCNPNGSRSFVMSANGFGNYIQNEYVYQGQNYDLAYATGKVGDWNKNTNNLYINEVIGNFKLNQPIIGTDSLAIHVPESPTSNTMLAFIKTYTPNPNTAFANSNYTIDTIVTEYNS